MTCNQCKYITVCMAQADGLRQVFDPNYDGEHGCTDFAPFTNADRIRSMSDEELAKHLVDIGWDCHLCAEHIRLENEALLRGEKCDEKCANHCLEWLQHPDEGE